MIIYRNITQNIFQTVCFSIHRVDRNRHVNFQYLIVI